MPYGLSRKYYVLLMRLVKFFFTSLLGTFLNMGVLWVLKTYALTGYWGQYLFSPFIAFECSIVVNYFISIYYIWPERVEPPIAKRSKLLLRFLGYNTTCAGGLAVKLAVILICERLTGWDVMYCNIIALAFSGTFNFLTQEFLVFKKKKK